jgi:glycolate oxidase FAD binding subunit
VSAASAVRVTSTADVVDAVRDAKARRASLRIVGRGGWLAAPSPAARIAGDTTDLDLSALAGIVEYVPADLTLTARAGTTLAELDAATAAHGQWCPLLPWGDDYGTVGATFATATNGPAARALGRPRDIALGVEFVDGTGALVRGGGRVVKNVAGFDLTRLTVGAFGSLGVITEVTVRLRARPPVDTTWCLTGGAGSAVTRAEAIRRSEIVPFACEPLDARLTGALGLPDDSVLVRLGGNRALVDAARAALASRFTIADADPAAWTKLRALDPHPREFGGNALARAIARRIKERFDPAGILNPGVLGEGT